MFLLEIFFQIFFEFLFEGIYELSLSKKTPLWLRISILFIYGFFMLIILIGIALLSLMLITDNKLFIGILILALDLFFVYGISKKLFKDFVRYPRV